MSTDVVNLQVQLARQPDGVPKPSDFQLAKAERPKPSAGQVLVRNIYLSLDPYQRGAIAGRFLGARLNQGDLIMGRCVGEVIESRHPDYKPGDRVVAESGWQQYFAVDGGARSLLRKIPGEAPLSHYLGPLGIPGLTAWAGVEKVAPPGLGETFVVSAAAGPVGGTAGQLAKAKGARVVGIAGSEQKCRLVTETYGFDACVNYKTDNWTDALKAACPGGIDIYFDNVGGSTLDAVMAQLAINGRIVLCGFIADYNSSGPAVGHDLAPLLSKQARMLNLSVYAHMDQLPRFLTVATRLWRDGRFKIVEDRADGIENAPAHFAKLMRGETVGKAMVVLGPEKV